MVTFQTLRETYAPTPGLGHDAPDTAALRELCFALLSDVPASERKAMLQRLERLRRADDVWHLRNALFETISRCHGEAKARERIAVLDARLR